MLRTRIITSVIALPILVLAIIVMPPASFSVLVGLLMLVGAWEWARLANIVKPARRVMYVVWVMAGFFLSVFFSSKWFLLIASLFWLWIFIAILFYQQNKVSAGFQFSFVRGLFGFVALIATWQSIVILKSSPDFGALWLIVLLLIIFSADIGAYFAGRAFGKSALCSRVSPKKTWEGFLGGLVFSMVVAAIGGYFLVTGVCHYVYFLLLSLVTALFSVVGDLGVSLQKRIVGLKDSGVFFPGHGGVLDRLDSVASASVVFVLGLLLGI